MMIVCPDVEVNPKMPRTKSKDVSEGNGAIYQDESGYDEPMMAYILCVFSSGT